MQKILFSPIPMTEKCFLDENIREKREYPRASMLRGERFFFQLAYQYERPDIDRTVCTLTVEGDLAPYVTVRRVENVPVRTTTNQGCDDGNYLRTEPGLYPDLLRPMDPLCRVFVTRHLAALWVEIRVPEDAPAGESALRFTLTGFDGSTDQSAVGKVLAAADFTAQVIGAALPPQEITVTQWFHADCLASYYRVEIFSEEHWRIMENFIATAVDNGIDMILTPVFTPPLDTRIGAERPTVQLTDVTLREDGSWHFGFDRLRRWVQMCDRLGVRKFEISHLFTQWGARHAPKVMAHTPEGYRRVFGWDTDATADEYRSFLCAFIPALVAEMEALGAGDRMAFHLSDEPGEDHLANYISAKECIKEALGGRPVMDALSNIAFFKTGAVETPVVSSDHIEAYLDAGVENLWTYYCCCQADGVSNRFLSMPTARNRIIGSQFYKYNIAGFLQWGYNFYYTEGSVELCDPYLCTDGNHWVPAGDAFSVYPAPDGTAYETIHLLGFTAALHDLRAFRLAESLCGRDAVMAVIEQQGEITFKDYPHSQEHVLGVRERINSMIARAIMENE